MVKAKDASLAEPVLRCTLYRVLCIEYSVPSTLYARTDGGIGVGGNPLYRVDMLDWPS